MQRRLISILKHPQQFPSSTTQLLYRILPSLLFFTTVTSFRFFPRKTIRTFGSEISKRQKQVGGEISMKDNNDATDNTSVRLDSPSAQRNKDVIWNVLELNVFPTWKQNDGNAFRVLEIAAGAGVHSHYFCQKLLEKQKTENFPSVHWMPTDPQDESRRSIAAYREDVPDVLHPPLALSLDENGIVENDLSLESGTFDLIVCINMIHISPWEATVGLMKEAQRLLKPGKGILYCYGPYREGGTAVESNM
jgi:SAM-dependent methyltransferase